jgi:hypothetical protein
MQSGARRRSVPADRRRHGLDGALAVRRSPVALDAPGENRQSPLILPTYSRSGTCVPGAGRKFCGSIQKSCACTSAPAVNRIAASRKADFRVNSRAVSLDEQFMRTRLMECVQPNTTRIQIMKGIAIFLRFVFLCAALTTPANAHEIRPAVMTLAVAEGRYVLDVTHNVEALLAG